MDEVANSSSNYQVRFEEGLKSINEGRYLAASEIFSTLYIQTNSPRVKLEWARSLYLAGQKNQSEKLFKEVLDSDPPFMVKERIGGYLDDIALTKGKFDYSFGLMVDSNPRTITNSQILNIFGQSFKYDPGFNRGNQLGLNYLFDGSKSLDGSEKLIGHFSVGGTKFEASLFDKTSVQGDVTYRFSDEPRLQAKIGLERYYFGGKTLYDSPSLGLRHSLGDEAGGYWFTDIKTGQMFYPEYSYMNGNLSSLTTSFGKPFFPGITLGLEIGVDRATANQNSYAFYTETVSGVINLISLEYSLKSQIKFTAAYRKYGDADPIFGDTRTDRRNGIYISFIKPNIKFFDLAPSLDLGWEKSSSNIEIYSYRRLTTVFSLKKVY